MTLLRGSVRLKAKQPLPKLIPNFINSYIFSKLQAWPTDLQLIGRSGYAAGIVKPR